LVGEFISAAVRLSDVEFPLKKGKIAAEVWILLNKSSTKAAHQATQEARRLSTSNPDQTSPYLFLSLLPKVL
jgi:hypothetical protein